MSWLMLIWIYQGCDPVTGAAHMRRYAHEYATHDKCTADLHLYSRAICVKTSELDKNTLHHQTNAKQSIWNAMHMHRGVDAYQKMGMVTKRFIALP